MYTISAPYFSANRRVGNVPILTIGANIILLEYSIIELIISIKLVVMKGLKLHPMWCVMAEGRRTLTVLTSEVKERLETMTENVTILVKQIKSEGHIYM